MKSIIILGKRKNGELLRPADWAERLCGQLSTFEKGCSRYSPLLHPIIHDSMRCLFVSSDLEHDHPLIWKSIQDFCHQEDLEKIYLSRE